MRNLGLVGSAILAIFSTTAVADSEWQTVSLDNNSSFTIDVPAVVGKDWLPSAEQRKQGELMFFVATTDSSGRLDCLLNETNYDKKFLRKDVIARLAISSSRDLLCTGNGFSNADVRESESLTSNGYPAGACAASYTDSSYRLPGQLVSTLAIAAPHKWYVLTCTVYDDSQADATAHWTSRWSNEVKHIQRSLRLPAREK
jgi:hypothetical protein